MVAGRRDNRQASCWVISVEPSLCLHIEGPSAQIIAAVAASFYIIKSR